MLPRDQGEGSTWCWRHHASLHYDRQFFVSQFQFITLHNVKKLTQECQLTLGKIKYNVKSKCLATTANETSFWKCGQDFKHEDETVTNRVCVSCWFHAQAHAPYTFCCLSPHWSGWRSKPDVNAKSVLTQRTKRALWWSWVMTSAAVCSVHSSWW